MPLNKETKLFVAQSAGTVEYTDFFFLPRDKTPTSIDCPGYETKKFDGEVTVISWSKL